MMPFIRPLRSRTRLVTFSSKVRNACLICLSPSGNPPPLSLPASREPRGSDNKRPPSDLIGAAPSSSPPTPFSPQEPCGTPPPAPAATQSHHILPGRFHIKRNPGDNPPKPSLQRFDYRTKSFRSFFGHAIPQEKSTLVVSTYHPNRAFFSLPAKPAETTTARSSSRSFAGVCRSSPASASVARRWRTRALIASCEPKTSPTWASPRSSATCPASTEPIAASSLPSHNHGPALPSSSHFPF